MWFLLACHPAPDVIEQPAIPTTPPSTDTADPSDCIVPLVVARWQGSPTRLFAVVEVDGEPAALLVDTGANVSFLSVLDQPDGTPDVGEVRIGCETLSFMGRPFERFEEEQEAGLPVLGFLGSDWFLERPTRIDIAGEQLARVDTADIAPTAHPLPYTNVFDFLFVDVRIDDVPLFLGFDTGANHTLWIGVDGQPGDQPVASQDGFGDPITYYLGTGTLAYGTEGAEVPVMRVLQHPSIEAGDAQMGIDGDGLFGLTSIPGPSIVIDSGSSNIWLE